jgi:hypothetical protein
MGLKMGYRSDVVMVIYGRDKQCMTKLKAMIDAAGIDLDKHWPPNSWGIDDKMFCFDISDVKWYEGFPEIDETEKIFQMAHDMEEVDGHERAKNQEPKDDFMFSGIFLRIGEEHTDIEEKHFGDPYDQECPYVYSRIEHNHNLCLGERLNMGAVEEKTPA